jgi:cation transport ATPase
MASNPPQQRHNLPQFSEETLRDLLSVQKQELALRVKEVERDNAEISLNQGIAQHTIEAQERDRQHEREEQTKRQRTFQNFTILVLLIILIFAGFAMWIGQKDLVLDMLKVVVGFVGGMGFQAYKNSKRQPSPSDD